MSLPEAPRRAGYPRALAAVAAVTAALASGPAFAVGQVAGPIEIGPSWAGTDPARSSATLNTVIVNHGDLADRLIRVTCPMAAQVALRNGTLHQDVQEPTTAATMQANGDRHPEQNGLDIPAALSGSMHPVTASFDLSGARQPLTEGALIPCALYFGKSGERLVMFTIGPREPASSEP